MREETSLPFSIKTVFQCELLNRNDYKDVCLSHEGSVARREWVNRVEERQKSAGTSTV